MTKTQTLETLLAALTVGGRMNPERSRAQPWYAYRNPEHSATFKRKQEERPVDRMKDTEIADSLLIDWYRWAKVWRPALGAPRISPSCRDYHQDEKHNEESDGYDALHKKEMKAVEFCVFALAVPLQQAIGTEMRNREVNAKVWRSPSNRSYSEALAAVMVGMKKHDDLRQLFN